MLDGSFRLLFGKTDSKLISSVVIRVLFSSYRTWSSLTSTHLIENGGSRWANPSKGAFEQLVTNCKKVKYHMLFTANPDEVRLTVKRLIKWSSVKFSSVFTHLFYNDCDITCKIHPVPWVLPRFFTSIRAWEFEDHERILPLIRIEPATSDSGVLNSIPRPQCLLMIFKNVTVQNSKKTWICRCDQKQVLYCCKLYHTNKKCYIVTDLEKGCPVNLWEIFLQ